MTSLPILAPGSFFGFPFCLLSLVAGFAFGFLSFALFALLQLTISIFGQFAPNSFCLLSGLATISLPLFCLLAFTIPIFHCDPPMK
ncbi:hypothetical protein N183_34660 [Sinorhizobium sp. Sb3]|nr:hypothetical protein N183_34660 [Sinorhizobium sp. Sb3]